jgi:hypothetical protein
MKEFNFLIFIYQYLITNDFFLEQLIIDMESFNIDSVCRNRY